MISSPEFGTAVDVPLDEIDGVMKVCLDYWQNLKGTQRAPTWRKFCIMDLPVKVIPFVTIVDVKREPLAFVYRFWGTGHLEAKRVERTGQTLLADERGSGDAALDDYIMMADSWSPQAFKRNIRLPEPRLPITQLSLRLPLSSTGEQVDQILSICDWWSFRESWPDFHPPKDSKIST